MGEQIAVMPIITTIAPSNNQREDKEDQQIPDSCYGYLQTLGTDASELFMDACN